MSETKAKRPYHRHEKPTDAIEVKAEVVSDIPAPVEPKQFSLVPINAERLISTAIEKGTPVDQLERLLAMRRELEAEFARKAYFEALAEFQKRCPEIKKTKVVYNRDGKTERYRYAPLEAIVAQTRVLLEECGFSYVLKPRQTDKEYIVVCVAHHKGGHEESTEFSVPIGSESFMTDVQKMGARNTYAKRYAFCNAFGIMTGDEDTDGKDTDALTGGEESKGEKTPERSAPPASITKLKEDKTNQKPMGVNPRTPTEAAYESAKQLYENAKASGKCTEELLSTMLAEAQPIIGNKAALDAYVDKWSKILEGKGVGLMF